MGELLFWMLPHFVLAAIGTWLARRYALRRELLDQPGERRSHDVPTARGGGIAIVASVMLGCCWLLLRWPEHAVLLGCFATGLVLVAGIGWVDDHRPLSPWLRLAVQALAGCILGWAMQRTTGALLPAVLTFALVMALANIWNFMDGIDGLAASQAAIVAAGLALVLGAGLWAWLGAAVLAAVCGFLPFNFPKARIFLGDVGSGALGYMLAALLAAAFVSGQTPWPLLLLPVSAFLVDAGFTLSMRMLRGERWWAPHVQHTYQRWARRQGGHVIVTLAYALFSVSAVILMFAGLRWRPSTIAWSCSAWFVFAILAWAYQRKEVRLSKEADQ